MRSIPIPLIRRSTTLRMFLLFVALAAASTSMVCAQTQRYPDRPVRLLVPYQAGGGPDAIARMLAAQLERQMGQPFVIDNRAGASGIIGIDAAAKGAPNGYTMLFVTSSVVVNQALRDKPPYDLERDFAPVTTICEGLGFLLVVHPSVRAETLAEFIALARQPGQHIAYGSSGLANVSHVTGEMFNLKAGTQLMHVPYKGSAPALTALLSGEVQALFVTPTIGVSPIKAGKLRALAFTGASRWKEMPELPSIGEFVPGFRMGAGWMGWLAPVRTPSDIVKAMQSEIGRALQEPKLREFITTSGYEPIGNTPEEFRRFMRSELVRFKEIAQAAKIKAE